MYPDVSTGPCHHGDQGSQFGSALGCERRTNPVGTSLLLIAGMHHRQVLLSGPAMVPEAQALREYYPAPRIYI